MDKPNKPQNEDTKQVGFCVHWASDTSPKNVCVCVWVGGWVDEWLSTTLNSVCTFKTDFQ